jgi:N-acetylglucosaminyl-diphospho-decaprenol L-rhamnosyltransferase
MNNNESLSILLILYEENFITISKCLENLKNFKVIIIDNAGDKILRDKIELKFKIYKYIVNKKNLGFPGAANQGIKLCDTEYLFILGADCLMSYQDIENLVIAKKKYKDCLIVSPTFYTPDGNLSYNGGLLPENGEKVKILPLEGDTCVEAILTTAVLFKREEMIKFGLLDEDLFLYFGDDDISRRIRKQKKSIIQIFQSRAVHVHGNLKIKNRFKKIFFRNFYYTHGELIYYYKVNLHQKKFNKLKKNIPIIIFKFFLNFFILRLEKSIYYFSQALAYFKFKKFINK